MTPEDWKTQSDVPVNIAIVFSDPYIMEFDPTSIVPGNTELIFSSTAELFGSADRSD